MSDKKTELQEFVESYPASEYTQTRTIVTPFKSSNYVYYVVAGKVIQYDIAENGTNITLNVFGSGAIVSLYLVLTEKSNDYYYETQGKTILRAIPKKEFYDFLSNKPQLAFELLKRVISGSDGLMKRLSIHMQGDASKRILIELLIESRRFCSTSDDSATITSTVKELASRCGMARETVSRQFAILSKMNLLEKSDSTIFIPSISKLEQMLHK
jgi:CRP-like cAMP-binding protein